ncbi:unnamed protein product [Caenorhabditis auriculariae]|uniref:Uncharacterized protein n=1 Tax=Caenorhabditis auriculariae TaxID=2777116 RepID=A0A8S1HSS7_9PELO|nr:unnamed protein product [Caenorhabditis auriculariae]
MMTKIGQRPLGSLTPPTYEERSEEKNVFVFLMIFLVSTARSAIFDPYPAYSYALNSFQQSNGYPSQNSYGSYQQNYGYPYASYQSPYVNSAPINPYPAYNYALGSYQQASGYSYSPFKSADGFYASCGNTAAVWGC